MAGFLDSLSGPAATDALRADATVLVPVGAVEQHGPHLPLSTDWVIADEAAKAVVAQLGGELDLWAIPALPYSKSNEHAWSPGTVWLSNHTMYHVLDDIGRCVAASGARRIVFLNAHGGNSALLMVACRELRLAHGLLTFLIHPFAPPAYSAAAADSPEAGDRPGSSELGMGIHAGCDETAIMLHLRPEDVDMSQAVANVPEWLTRNEHVRFGGSAHFGWLSNDFGPSGVIGDPTAATAELGKELFAAAVDHLCAQLREIAVFDYPGVGGSLADGRYRGTDDPAP